MTFKVIFTRLIFNNLTCAPFSFRNWYLTIAGTGAVVAAGFLGASKMADIPLREHKIVFYGAGSAAVGTF